MLTVMLGGGRITPRNTGFVGCPSHTPRHCVCFNWRLFNNFARSAAFAEVCAILNAILFLPISREVCEVVNF